MFATRLKNGGSMLNSTVIIMILHLNLLLETSSGSLSSSRLRYVNTEHQKSRKRFFGLKGFSVFVLHIGRTVHFLLVIIIGPRLGMYR